MDTTETYYPTRESADWIRPTAHDTGIQQLLAALRSGWWFVVLALVLSLLGLGAYLARADTVYRTSADILVTPAPGGDEIPGVTLLWTSDDPIRNVETVARLVTAPNVARRVTRDLRLDRSPDRVRDAVDATPVAESDIVTITAVDSDPRTAQRLANGFAAGVVAERTEALHEQLDGIIPQVEARLAQTDSAALQETLAARLADLQTLRDMPDPTVRQATSAELPKAAISPRPMISTVVAVMAGLLIGVGGIIALQLLDPRVVSEDQLRDRYRLPILARIRHARVWSGRLGRLLRSSASSEANIPVAPFRTLRAALMARATEHPAHRVVVLIGPSPADGRLVARGIARSLVAAGRSVLVAEIDGSRPSVARSVWETSEHGVMDVLSGRATVQDAIVFPEDDDRIAMLVDTSSGDRLPDVLDRSTARILINEATAVSDWLLVVAPPYARAADALPLVLAAGHVLVAVRVGTTRATELRRVTDLLGDNAVAPAGFVLLTASRQSAST